MPSKAYSQRDKEAVLSALTKHSSVPSSAYSLGSCGRRGSEVSLNTTSNLIPKTRIITRCLVRDLNVPREKQPELTAFVTDQRLRKLKENARIVSEAEKEAEIQKEKEDKDKLREASNFRRAKMEELDLLRKKQEQVNEMEAEELQKTQQLRKMANEARLENEEEIKEINELILAAKVQAIRDDQAKEKKIIKQQLKKAETELDEMMVNKRIEGIKREEEKAAKRKAEAYEAAGMLKEQIEANHERRILEKEKKAKEGEEMKKYFDSLLQEDIEKMKEQKLKQRELLETLLRDNAEIARQKEYKKEQSKQEDIMIAAYQKHKAEKEEAAEAAAKEKKRQRELEIAKMREQQEKASDIQAEKDALRARRAQEEKERAYRQAEKERALKNKKMQEDLQKHRAEQQENQNLLQLLKAEKDRKEFEALVERNKLEMQNEEILRNRKRLLAICHADEVRKQIMKKEKERISERKEFFQEGLHKQQEEKIRKQRLDALRTRKLNELRNYDIPENYVTHIQRKVVMKQG